MEGPLFNPGFLGGKFLWFVGQVADDSTWRENQNPAKNEDPEEDMPGWGYRYKIRIIGLHDQAEEEIESEDLPWAQVMYSVWGGGIAGSRQTPGIRQGMFVFGFFLDGQDQQVPVIMGVLGANAKTVTEDLKTGKTGGKNFAPQSGFANADEDETKVTPDDQIQLTEPKSVGTTESTDNIHQETADDRRKNDVLKRKHALSCPDPKHQSDVKNLQTATEQLSTDIQNLQRAQKDYANAVGLPVIGVKAEVQGLIDNAAGEMSGHMKETMGKVQQFTTEEYNKEALPILNLAVPSFKNQLFKEHLAGLEEICCMFNALNAGLAGLIGAALAKSFANKSKQSQSGAVQSANEAAGVQPKLDTPVEIPPLPPEGFYSPSPICSTEELMGEVLGGTINKISSTFTSAKNRVVTTANDGTNPDIATAAGSSPTQSVDMSISQNNVTEALKSGALVGGMAGAFAAAVGVDVSTIGSVSSAFKSGNYASGLASMAKLAALSSPQMVVATAALHAIESGDIVGGFTEAASAFGVPPGMMSNMGGAFAAIQSGDMSALTGQIQGLASFDPQAMLGSVSGLTGMMGGGGMGALGGMMGGGSGGGGMDIASSMNFTQSLTKFFECDDEVECSPNDVHTLDGGGESTDGASCASISEAANNAAAFDPVNKQSSEEIKDSFNKPALEIF